MLRFSSQRLILFPCQCTFLTNKQVHLNNQKSSVITGTIIHITSNATSQQYTMKSIYFLTVFEFAGFFTA